jgi:large subunit ribosomal protein L6
MSRVGTSPIPVPGGVEVSISGADVTVKGPKGSLDLAIPGDVSVRQDGDELIVERPNDERQSRALHGLVRSLINNMVEGVTNGFKKELEINGVGYRAEAKGKDKLQLALGFSHPIEYQAPDGVTFDVPQPTQVIVEGIDKQLVGQVAANIRSFRKPEPYKGKGIKYIDERIIRKAGKAGK